MMYSTELFVDYIVQELSNRGVNGQCGAQQIAGAIQRVLQPPAPVPTHNIYGEQDVVDIPNHVLIHEMLKRGFAVSKIPEERAAFDAAFNHMDQAFAEMDKVFRR